MDLVSAVITTHNRKKLLERAVNSVLAQTYANMELIIVDDASSDDTEQYCRDLCHNNCQIQYVRISKEASRGGNYARNLGIRHARGKWIAFLDDDDEWLPEKTQRQMDYLHQHQDVKAVSSDLEYVFVYGDRQYSMHSNFNINNNKPNDFFVSSWMNVTSTMIIERSALNEIGGFDEELKAIQEIEMSYRVCLAFKVAVVKESLIRYYQYTNDSNQVTNSVEKYLAALEYIESKYKNYLDDLDDEQKLRLEVGRKQNIAIRYLRVDRRQEYRKCLKPYVKYLTLMQKLEYLLSYILKYEKIILLKCLLKRIRG